MNFFFKSFDYVIINLVIFLLIHSISSNDKKIELILYGTVLCMYKGQLMLFRRLVKEAFSTNEFTNESLDDVRMTTTDNYQGEESDIVRIHFFISIILILLTNL